MGSQFYKTFFYGVLIFCGSIAGLHASQYALTLLNGFASPYTPECQAYAINSHGQVAGMATGTDGEEHAFYYDGQMHELGTGTGYAINDTGVVAGQDGNLLAFYNATHTTNGNVEIIPLGGGTAGNGAEGINNSGVVVGNSYLDNKTSENPNAYEFPYPSGPATDLGDILGSTDTTYYSEAFAINSTGVIAGVVEGTAYGGYYFPAINSGTGFDPLPLLTGAQGGAATAINSFSTVVGQSGNNDGSGIATAVMWMGTNITVIVPTNISIASTANGINDTGTVVGWLFTTNSFQHAFVYSGSGDAIDLNTLISGGLPASVLYLTTATGVNNSGVIVGYGYYTNYSRFGFIATPVASGPTISTSQLVLTNKQIEINFLVGSLTNATFHLLQANTPNSAYTTNATAVLTTNLANSSYRFTVTNNSTERFYRVKTP